MYFLTVVASRLHVLAIVYVLDYVYILCVCICDSCIPMESSGYHTLEDNVT